MKTKRLIFAVTLAVLSNLTQAQTGHTFQCKISGLSKAGVGAERRTAVMVSHQMGHQFIQMIIPQDRSQATATAMIHEVLADYYSTSFRNDPDLIVRKMTQKSSFETVTDSDVLKDGSASAGNPLRFILWSLRQKLGGPAELDTIIYKTTQFWGRSDVRYKDDAKRETWKKMTMDYLDYLRLNLQDTDRSTLDKLMEEVDLY